MKYLKHIAAFANRLLMMMSLLLGISTSLATFADSNAATPTPPTAPTTSTSKKLKFATEATYPPIVSMSADGKIGGFETELCKAICKASNLECEFIHRPFDSLFPNLSLKKIDVVYGGVGISEERKGQVLFSKSLYSSPTGFLFPSDTAPSSLTKEALQGKTIAIQQGTSGYEKYFKNHYPEVKLKSYASIQDALLDLRNHRVQAAFGDILVFKHWMKNSNQSNFTALAIPKEHVMEFTQGVALAVRKEDTALMQQLNAAFDKIVQDGTFKKLQQQYFDSLE
jgi:ABC-type amino acid transport substrate-binding protein